MANVKITDSQRRGMIEILVADDIQIIKEDMAFDDYSFISNVLSGFGWKSYVQFGDEEIISEFLEREFFGEESLASEGVEEISDLDTSDMDTYPQIKAGV